MIDKEKKATELLKGLCSDDCINKDIVDTIVNLIEKQQKEIEELKNTGIYKVEIIDKENYVSKEELKAITRIAWHLKDVQEFEGNEMFEKEIQAYFKLISTYYSQQKEIEELKKENRQLKQCNNNIYATTVDKEKIRELLKVSWTDEVEDMLKGLLEEE